MNPTRMDNFASAGVLATALLVIVFEALMPAAMPVAKASQFATSAAIVTPAARCACPV
jgi:hypothetical protein